MGTKRSERSRKHGSGAGGGRGRPRGAAGDGDAELLARLLVLQERTAEVGRQLRLVGELLSTAMRDATVSAAEVIEQIGAAADADSPEPPPVAARRRRPPPG